jgi:hypothetical protein
MSRPIRSTLRRATPGLEIVPPSLLVLLDHPWLGAASLVVALTFTTLHSRMVLRAEKDRDQTFTAYAHTTASLGVDPHRLFVALSRDPADEAPVELPPARLPYPRGRDESSRSAVS